MKNLTSPTMTVRCYRTISQRFCLAVLCALAALGVIGFVARAQSQSQVSFSQMSVDYAYGEQAVFSAQVAPAADIQQVYLFIQAMGEDTRPQKVDIDSQGEVKFTYDLKAHPLRPFARTDYWLIAVSSDGKQHTSLKSQFEYIDNREPWQTLDAGHFQVNWLVGDLAFGQNALNSVERGVTAASKLVPGQNLDQLKVYIYDSAARLQSVLNYNPNDWAVGEASPDLGVVLVSIPTGPGQQEELDRQIPHEIMHVLTYKIVTQNYQKVPVWLGEGLASLAETYPNPDYQRTLNKAVKTGSLTPMTALCGAFPQEAAAAFQAYAQSASFVQFLQNKFGSSGLLALVNAYKNGYSCEDGVQTATGSSLSQLDYRWRQETLGVDAGSLAIQNLSPYLVVIAILLVVPFLVGGWWYKRARA